MRPLDGRIVAIRGGVVDVAFDGQVPRIHDLLYAGDVALEVSALLEAQTVRAMAMAPVRGLGLGMSVRSTGAPIMVPVGSAVLGRMLDVFGAPIDGRPAPATTEASQYPPVPLLD
ncbi:ATP synthase subunit beta 2 [Nymphon striatum]|nr:ATP synthase subunit beta 2 [Nymphon striatum]